MGPAIPAFSPLWASQPSFFSANSPGEPSTYLICSVAVYGELARSAPKTRGATNDGVSFIKKTAHLSSSSLGVYDSVALLGRAVKFAMGSIMSTKFTYQDCEAGAPLGGEVLGIVRGMQT
jgi:hypothetical protein